MVSPSCRTFSRRNERISWVPSGSIPLVGSSKIKSRGRPSSAFFYVITWAHAAHVVGALAAVLYVEYRALRFELGPGRRTLVTVSAIFWHFLDVVWIGVFTFVYLMGTLR